MCFFFTIRLAAGARSERRRPPLQRTRPLHPAARIIPRIHRDPLPPPPPPPPRKAIDARVWDPQFSEDEGMSGSRRQMAAALAAARALGAGGGEMPEMAAGSKRKRTREAAAAAAAAAAAEAESESSSSQTEEGEDEDEAEDEAQDKAEDEAEEEEEDAGGGGASASASSASVLEGEAGEASPPSGGRGGEAAQRAGLRGADSGGEGKVEEEEPPEPARPTFEKVASITGPTTPEDLLRLPCLSPVPPLTRYPMDEFPGAPKKKYRVTVGRVLKFVEWDERRLLSELGLLMGSSKGLALRLLLESGIVFSLPYRYDFVAWQLARLACSKDTWPRSHKWCRLPGDSSFGGLVRLRQWRTAKFYNFLAEAIRADTGGFRSMLTDAFKNARAKALINVLSTLDELHRSGEFSLGKDFYEACLDPLEKPAALAAYTAAKLAQPAGTTAAEREAAGTAAGNAYWASLDETPPCQRLLSKQGSGHDCSEGFLNDVLKEPPRSAGIDARNPLCAITGVVHGLTNAGREKLLEEGGPFGREMYLAVTRGWADPLDQPADEPPGAGLYFFVVLCVKHYLDLRSRQRGMGIAHPKFSAKAFPALRRLWEGVALWHARLPTDLPYLGIEPRGGGTMASWGFVDVSADDLDATVAAFAINPSSPPAKRARRQRRGGGGRGGGRGSGRGGGGGGGGGGAGEGEGED